MLTCFDVKLRNDNLYKTKRKKNDMIIECIVFLLVLGYLHMTQDKKNWQKRFFAIHQDFVLFSFKAHQVCELLEFDHL